MTRSRTPSPAARRALGEALEVRSGGVLWFAVALAAAVSGCQFPNAGVSRNATAQPSPQGSTETPSIVKTDFHKDLSPEQGFNVHMELGRLYETQGNFDAAVAEYQLASETAERKGSVMPGAKIGPAQRSQAERRLGAALDRLGRFAQAETHYRKALGQTPRDAKVWNDIGYSYYLQSRFADAERSLEQALAFEPNNARVLTNLGMTLAAEGKTDEALKALTQAGGPAVGRANLGFILAALGKTNEARFQYESALALQPDLATARKAIDLLDAQLRVASAPPSAPAVSPIPAAAAVPPPPPVAAVSRPATALPPAPAPVAVSVVTQAPAPAPAAKPVIRLEESASMTLPALPPSLATTSSIPPAPIAPASERPRDATVVPTTGARSPQPSPTPAAKPTRAKPESVSDLEDLPALPPMADLPTETRVAATEPAPAPAPVPAPLSAPVFHRDPMVTPTSATFVRPKPTTKPADKSAVSAAPAPATERRTSYPPTWSEAAALPPLPPVTRSTGVPRTANPTPPTPW